MASREPTPPVMAATLDGPPKDPHDFYSYTSSTPTSAIEPTLPPLPEIRTDGFDERTATRSYSRSPTRKQPRSVSNPVTSSSHALNSARSNPVLLPSRQPGSVKDIANRFNQGAAAGSTGPPSLTVRTTQDRYRRPVPNKSTSARSPVSAVGGKTEMAKLQKRRPGQPRSPQKSPQTSFENSSFSSNGTISSAKSQPHAAASPHKSALPLKPATYVNTKPLFGELTADGWHGNFDLSSYGPLPSFQPTQRRQSDGGVALGHGRSHSHQDISQPTLSPPVKQALSHKRSRSDMDALRPSAVPSMPNLNAHATPALYPTPPNSGTRNAVRKDSPTSRIPISSRRQSEDSAGTSDPYSRSASAMSNPAGRRHLSKSPTRPKQVTGKENNPASITRSRYQPPPISTSHSNHMLSAKIVAPLPKTSPPLRSSRPRQPVSAATTSASRARAAERFTSPMAKDGRRPSEQWLGKPYDPQRERTKRKIPELGKVDFAERRARIQKAISRNLEESKSKESLRSESRKEGLETTPQASGGAEVQAQMNPSDEQEVQMDSPANVMDRQVESTGPDRPRGLSLDTTNVANHANREPEPMTAATEFEVDESPVLGRPEPERISEAAAESQQPDTHDLPVLLSATTYQPPAARPCTPPPTQTAEATIPKEVQSPSVLENAMRMRERSASSGSRAGTEFAEDSPSVEDSPSDMEDRWGLGHGLGGDQGSIKIMLDEDPTLTHQVEHWSKNIGHDLGNPPHVAAESERTQQYNQHAFTTNGFTDSPVDADDGLPNGMVDVTPRKHHTSDDTLKAKISQPGMAFTATSESLENDAALAHAIDQYQVNGTVAPEMLQYIENHSVDLQRISANGGSDAMMVQNLLDSMFVIQPPSATEPEAELLPPAQYEIPAVTPDTPPDAAMAIGTAVVYGSEPSRNASDEDFEAKIRKADEEWERQQRGEDVIIYADDEERPTPPPKDIGYTPRSSTGPNSAVFPPADWSDGLRISTVGDLPQIQTAEASVEGTPVNDKLVSPTLAPPQPVHAPPPPPSPLTTSRLPYGMPEVPPMPASYSERGSSELSPRVRKNLWGPSGSSRPSIDSQRAPGPPSLPGAQSMSSFADSTRHNSIDTGADSQTKLVKTTSPGPEHKRLMKRRHIIKELLDTENTYHQDLKIIEDIYKATVADLVAPEDKKILFGNCDEIERFSLHFYDELRRAVSSIYQPPKQMRWANKRTSNSTMQSDTTGQTSMASTDTVDDEKDRATSVGQCFLSNMQQMDHVYGAYLRNHDAANQRLVALKNTPTVKCWLDECHNNASDITSAWDLDSLLVKPTQRVSKYPMLLQQLLETTPASHPDHEALKTAAKDSIAMLMRINEAKKRADIVDQIINHKGKDNDVRVGLAKAFGRRTEKLKERVGLAEAFQDAEFDELSHKFGGHFIRLQICMRDVQDYVHRIEKAMHQISNTAGSLELFTDVSISSLPEIESKWRKYGQAIREIENVAFKEHKDAVSKRVIQPMITCIKLHDGPQNAINQRKKRIVDYAKCKSIEKRGEKPDKKTLEASEAYVALNDHLKIELPKLYNLTANLVQACLNCFLDIQLTWYNMWERKLKPILEASDIPTSLQQIEPAFRPDYELVKIKLAELAICNGALLADSANFLSPTTTFGADSSESSRRPSTLDASKRTMSVGSDASPSPFPGLTKRHSNGYAYGSDGAPPITSDGRMRSNSSMSSRTPLQTPGSGIAMTRQWSNTITPTSAASTSRPATANSHSASHLPYPPTLPPRQSSDIAARSPRPSSQQTYFTARPDQTPIPDQNRFSGLFTSAYPPDTPESTRPVTPKPAEEDLPPAMFVCASLFEFSIDKTRKEAGYPYLTYSQGEVFDVIAQKGELWLAKNQDDDSNTLGWIWEQHFVILSQD